MDVRSAIDFYDRHPISADIIRAKLAAARGHLDDVAPAELLPHDQDHYGGDQKSNRKAGHDRRRLLPGKGTDHQENQGADREKYLGYRREDGEISGHAPSLPFEPNHGVTSASLPAAESAA